MNKSPDLKKTIIALHNSGSSSHKIAHQLSLSRSTVSRLIKRYKQTGDDVPSSKKGSGGRFSLSTREIRIINRESLIHPHLTAANIQVSVGGKCQNLSVRTIRRYLRRSNILAYRPSKSPALTARQRKRRYDWALAHKRHDWSKTAFSDETYICLQPNCPGQYVRRQKGQRINLNHCKHNRAFCKKIMVWAVIDESGPGSIVCFRGTMDSVKYKNLMESVIIPFSNMIRYFQHDNAPPHKAQSVVNALNDNGVSVLDWPPYSPDANPIENVWAVLKEKIRQRYAQTLDELENAIQDVWANDSTLKSCCVNGVKNMSKRIEALEKSRGGFIK